MSRLLTLLVLLFVFDATLVAARPRSPQRRSSPTLIDLSGLNTNGKRLARGLPPLPPPRKRVPTRVDTAKRSSTSQCAKSGFIQVFDAQTKGLRGYISKRLRANQHYTLADRANAGVFSSTVSTSGKTDNLNIMDVNNGDRFLAGLIKKNEQLGDGKGDDKAAILGNSLATNPGDPPQADKDPSWNNRDAESAIWTYDRGDDTLTPTWVNYGGQTVLPHIYWLSDGGKFYLTNSADPQNGLAVYFKYISVGDQCGLPS